MAALRTDNDWLGYGDVPQQMQLYHKAMAVIPTYATWNNDQKRLHRLIFLRGFHPMLPSWWAFHFKMWQISPDCFAPVGSRKEVAIYSTQRSEMSAARALEDVFNLTHKVADYMSLDEYEQAGTTIVRSLRKFVRWAYQDVGIEDYANAEHIVLLQQYPHTWGMEHFNEMDPSDEIETEEDSSDEERPERSHAKTSAKKAAREAEARQARIAVRRERRRAIHFGQAVDSHAKVALQAQAARLRGFLTDPATGGLTMPVPTLYMFLVVQDSVMITSWDPLNPNRESVTHEKVDFGRREDWLGNALSIALTVHQARDALVALYSRRKKPVILDMDM